MTADEIRKKVKPGRRCRMTFHGIHRDEQTGGMKPGLVTIEAEFLAVQAGRSHHTAEEDVTIALFGLGEFVAGEDVGHTFPRFGIEVDLIESIEAQA